MEIKERELVITNRLVKGFIDEVSNSYVSVDFEDHYRVFNKKSFYRDIDGTLRVDEYC